MTWQKKDGSLLEVEVSAAIVKNEKGTVTSVSSIRDITERKRMEKQFFQSEKLKSLGELAGGVAHDFNNVLAAILGRVQLLRMHLAPVPGLQKNRKSALELHKGLEVIEKAAFDGAETVRRIQEFSRKRPDDKHFKNVDINQLIKHALEFARPRWKDQSESHGIKITVKQELSRIPTTSGREAELREVFTNLINNALDAMPQGGCLTIRTFRENDTISVTIKDTGKGIPQELQERIFDPFFTTKGPQSSGLGLSVSYGIITRHRGTIAVDSTEGEGTAFTIKLPIEEVRVIEAKPEIIAATQKKARILVVEDEEGVRNVLHDILAEADHQVETASDGATGIELFERKAFDLVFTDLGMPGMSGWQVAEKIKCINRTVPVALITGWSVELKESNVKDHGVDLIIKKPFAVNQVLQLVQEGMELRERFNAA
jgi:signal transduction histidine kinase/CheY-like chemotaxis protein